MSGRRLVLFDYGNTLVPFGRREASVVDARVADAVAAHVAGLDAVAFRPRVRAVKDRLVRRTRETGAEIGLDELADALAAEAGASAAPAGLRDAVAAATGDAFARAVALPAGVLDVLDAIRDRRTLGLVSNYFLAGPIRESLDAFGLRDRFDAVVVSAEIGRVKPRPEPFLAAVEALGADPREAVFVGDNLHADVGGAAALGMATVHTREWLDDALPHDAWEAPAGVAPDAIIHRLADLPALLDRRWPR